MIKRSARFSKPAELKERTFNLQITEKCETKRVRVNCKLEWVYILRDEMKSLYKQENEDEDEYDDE